MRVVSVLLGVVPLLLLLLALGVVGRPCCCCGRVVASCALLRLAGAGSTALAVTCAREGL